MADIFLSYAREDKKKAEMLANALESQGWTVFWDGTSLLKGQDFKAVIDKAIQQVGCMVVAWSEASKQSDWVRGEAGIGRERNILVPILFEPVEPPIAFRSLHTENLTDWDGEADAPDFLKLCKAINERIKSETAPSTSSTPSNNASDKAVKSAKTNFLKRLFRSVWDWLSVTKHQQTLAFIGGGLAVVIAGSWQAYLHFSKKPAEANSTISVSGNGIANTGSMTATAANGGNAINAVGNCGVAAGHDANGNIITCNYGLSPKQMKELTLAAVEGATEPLLGRIETLSKRLGVTEEAARMMLKLVGEQPNVPDEDLAKALTKVAIDYKNLKAQAASIDINNSLARTLVTEVQSEITAGHLQKAAQILQKITKRTATLSGTCTKTEAMGVLVDPKFCLPQILNTEYRDDRNAFTFVMHLEDKLSVISFSGYGPDQSHFNSDEVLQPIDKVVFTFQGSSDHLKADGNCYFTNPYKEKPSTVSCKAMTSEGTFSGEFISNSISPNIFESDTRGHEPRHLAIETDKLQFLEGYCEPSSHIADGRIGEDLTKRQSQFFCDTALIIPFSDNPKHHMIQFADSHSHHARILGFGGIMEDSAIMTVHNIYLEMGGRASKTSDGLCKLFFEKQEISGISCGAKVDEGDQRTVPIVRFKVDKTGKTNTTR